MESEDRDRPSMRRQFDVKHHEGVIEVSAGELYFREFGRGDEVLVGLHGGPGAGHDYLAPLARLATADRRVILYDQFGCGRSDRPPAKVYDYYTIDSYRDRLEEVRQAIGVETIHLYGQSWGGWLALAYALAYPDHVASLVLANTSASTDDAIETMRATARSCLEPDERAEFDALIESRSFDDDRFQAFNERFTDEHVNRSDTDPFSFQPPTSEEIYGLMWGPSEFVMAETARLHGWDVTDRLEEITCPALVINGEYDEIAPELGEAMADAIPDGRFESIADASHLTLWEQPERHDEVVESFLDGLR